MYEVAQDQGKDDNINIILHHNTCANDKGSADIYKKILSFKYCTSTPQRVIYQMGHLLGLFKTQYGTGGGDEHHAIQNQNPCDAVDTGYGDLLFLPNYEINTGGIPENVTRDINNPYYNANIAGDMVIDTPACFRGSEHNFCHLTYGNSSYEYIEHQSIVDDTPEYLMYQDVDLLNFMSLQKSYLPSFNRQHFSNGQGVRMRETIAIPSLNFNEVETDLSELYKPYKVESIHSISDEIQTLTDNGDGTAEVCRFKSFTLNHYFQPGFDYDFYQGSPSNFNHHVTKGDLYGILDIGILRSVHINQINPNFITVDDYTASLSDVDNGIIMYEPLACIRNENVVCQNEQYSGGRVLSTTNLANPNVNIKVLDNQEASNPNLEQDLENGKYHIIEKTTTSGAKIHKTIYKNGN